MKPPTQRDKDDGFLALIGMCIYGGLLLFAIVALLIWLLVRRGL